jgi:ParG protein
MKTKSVVKKPKLSADVSTFAQGRHTRGRKPVSDRSPLSRNAPEGDQRLTINLREDLHLRLKIASAKAKTTIGAIVADLVERHVEG